MRPTLIMRPSIVVILTAALLAHARGAAGSWYLGCYWDDPSRLFPELKDDFPGSLTNGGCMEHCRRHGYNYAGTEYSRECFCSSKRPSYKRLTVGDECNAPCDGHPDDMCGGNYRLTVHQIDGALVDPVAHKYQGCYRDIKERVLPLFRYDSEEMTPEMCVGICYSKGFQLAGAEYGKECHCGDFIEDEYKTDAHHCETRCSGNNFFICGGVWHLSLYSTDIFDYSDDVTYLGCYKDNANSRLFSLPKRDLKTSNSPMRCANLCRSEGYSYSGVEYGYECFCGNNKPGDHLVVGESECNARCSGNSEKFCGGNWRLQLYYTGLYNPNKRPVTTERYVDAVTEWSPGVEHTTRRQVATTRRPPSQTTKRPGTTTGGACKPSATLNRGKAACAGRVIFSENFNGKPIDSNKWSHSVFMPWTPDYEFVVFNKDSKNSFVQNGILHIKPTLRDEANVLAGVLNLKDCTGVSNREECERKAVSYSILPPIQSARLHTKDTFTFRYGIIDIRAKLPVGEWIVPELWLEPARESYGADYSSGRIRIAMSRGNRELKDSSGVDSGCNRLESGVLMGHYDDVRQRSVAREDAYGWYSQFHNYTLIWKPDNLVFLVDGEERETLLPEGKSQRMCDLLGFPQDAANIWRTGSMIAPCDKDFYLSIGVSVGGIRDFADQTTSETGPKPWKNTEVKALLKFWRAKEKWYSTWDPIDSALQIDSITVRALG